MEACTFFCTNDGVTVWGWGGYGIVVAPLVAMLVCLFLLGVVEESDPVTVLGATALSGFVTAAIVILLVYALDFLIGLLAAIVIGYGVWRLGRRFS